MKLASELLVAILLTILVGFPPNQAIAQKNPGSTVKNEIWFVPQDPIYRHRRGFPTQDYSELLNSDSSWPIGMRNIDVFGIGPQMIEMGPSSLISKVVNFVVGGHYALDVEMHMDTYGNGDCGHIPYIESYSAPGVVQKDLERIKNLGADIRFLTMDEPLWFGAEFNGSTSACHDSLGEIARRVAVNVGIAKALFPNVKIGEVEPFTGTRANWGMTLREWLLTFKAATGAYPAYLHADISWNNHASLPQVYDIARYLHGGTIRFGVIYYGDASDSDGLEFNRHAESRFRAIEQTLGWRPDAIIMSWVLTPLENLPERREGTLTNLLARYIRWEETSNVH